MRVVNFPADDHAVSKYSLIVCAGLFRHTPAREIINCHNNFHAYQANLLEGKASRKPRRAHSNAFAAPTCPHPVTKIAKVIHRMDMTQTASAEDGAGFCIRDDECEQRAFLPARPRNSDKFF